MYLWAVGLKKSFVKEKGFQGGLEKPNRGSMQLIPGCWNQVKKKIYKKREREKQSTDC